MSDDFVVKPLASAQIGQAFPLISIVDRDITEKQWSNYATTLLTAPGSVTNGGILTAQSTQSYIHALSIYWVKPDLRHDKLLEIENFAAVDMVGNLAPARVLLEGLDTLARQKACNCISISLLNPYMRKWLRDSRSPAIDLFRSIGFQGDQLRLRKCF